MLTDTQQATLRALCDTFVPSLSHADDPHGLWARSATDVGADQGILQVLETLPDDQRAGLLQLLDALVEQGFLSVSRLSREQLLRNISLASRDAAGGVAAMGALTLFMTYGLPDPQTGQNPNWQAFGYPGPVMAPPEEAKRITPLVPDGDTTLE